MRKQESYRTGSMHLPFCQAICCRAGHSCSTLVRKKEIENIIWVDAVVFLSVVSSFFLQVGGEENLSFSDLYFVYACGGYTGKSFPKAVRRSWFYPL